MRFAVVGVSGQGRGKLSNAGNSNGVSTPIAGTYDNSIRTPDVGKIQGQVAGLGIGLELGCSIAYNCVSYTDCGGSGMAVVDGQVSLETRHKYEYQQIKSQS